MEESRIRSVRETLEREMSVIRAQLDRLMAQESQMRALLSERIPLSARESTRTSAAG
jgi:hypothetical protein